ncbi:MAG: oligosaccharide flippase family protein [Acidobacteria bacterium]|nr:oligosaccharide flippase family protein [Acidobacteriota bacterium]
MSSSANPPGPLLERAARSAFWNATLLPLITIFNLVAAIVIRRYFGLQSGQYDVMLGLVNSWLMWSGLGLPAAITQFAGQLEADGGRRALQAFLARIAGARIALLVLLLVPVNLFAEPLAQRLALGDAGALLIHLASVWALFRAANDLVTKSLQALLRHLAANLLLLAQAVGSAFAVVLVVRNDGAISTVIVGLICVATVLAALGFLHVQRSVRTASPADADVASEIPAIRRVSQFSTFMYGLNWLQYFASPAFASPAIAAVTGLAAPVALFNVGVQLPQMAIVLVLAGLQGLYRPLFSRLVKGDPAQLRNAFVEITKLQSLVLLPAGMGLVVMADWYIPIMFGDEYMAAAELTRVLAVLLTCEALFNLGGIILTADHRYRAVACAESARLVAAAVFVYLAAQGNLVAAAAAFGGGRATASVLAYWSGRQRYGLRFPMAFLARAAMPTLVMGLALWQIRGTLESTLVSAIGVTLLGALIVAICTKLFRVLGPAEIDLIERSRLPAGRHLVRWLR